MWSRDDVVRQYADRHDLTVKESAAIISQVIDILKEGILYHGGVKIVEFGSWQISHRKGHIACDPRFPHETKGDYEVLPYDYPKFKPSKKLVAALNHRDVEQEQD